MGDDRQHNRACASAQRRGSQKRGEDQAIGRSRGGLSTKIHATVDALGNPTGFFLTPGQACDLDGSDVLLADVQADTLIADKAYDADERVIKLSNELARTLLFRPAATAKIPALMTRSFIRSGT